MSVSHRTITDAERRARLAHRHRLLPARRIDEPARITDDLVALHSSDPASVFLSAALRMASPSIEAIDAALYEDRSLVRHHAMRRTLWVMTPETAARAHASSGRKVARAERRTLLKRLAGAAEIDEPERWLEDALKAMVAEVERSAPISTRRIGERLPHLRVPVAYPAAKKTTVDIAAHTKVIQLAGFEGRVVRTRPQGSWINSQYAWDAMERWIPGGVDELDTAEAQAELLDHWLRRFGPGTDRDLAWWTGWTKTDVARALESIDAEPVTLESDDRGWLAAEDADDGSGQSEWVALLPGLDPTPMGWKDRSWFLDADIEERVFDRYGNAGPTIWVDGQVVGGWVQRPDGSLALDVQRTISDTARERLAAECERIRDLVGDVRFRVRFPARNQNELLSRYD